VELVDGMISLMKTLFLQTYTPAAAPVWSVTLIVLVYVIAETLPVMFPALACNRSYIPCAERCDLVLRCTIVNLVVVVLLI
jgi:hypothetical protein